LHPAGDILWNYSSQCSDETIFLGLRAAAKEETRRRRYPTNKQRKTLTNKSSITVRFDHSSGTLLVEIDINIEDKPANWQGWNSSFLHLSLQLQLSLRDGRIHQQPIDAYLSYNGSEVPTEENHLHRIEKYTKDPLPLKYTPGEGWRIKKFKILRNVLIDWEELQ
jgi:hypothetical protein